MNCQHVRQKLSNVVAAGEPGLSTELALHLGTCSSCRSFYDSEAKLLLSIDAGLSEIVNQSAPPWPLLRVRERLDAATPQRIWLHALLPATAVLVIAGLYITTELRYKFEPSNQAVASAQPMVPRQPNTNQSFPITSDLATALPARTQKPSVYFSGSQQSVAIHGPSTPEVLVGAEELMGLKLLASTVYHEPQVGNAILNPVVLPRSVSKPIDNQEIAPLEVASLEIRPLLVEDQ